MWDSLLSIGERLTLDFDRQNCVQVGTTLHLIKRLIGNLQV